MLVIKDSMILIHLASVGVLREACNMFTRVIVPCAVHNEVVEKRNAFFLTIASIRKILANHCLVFPKYIPEPKQDCHSKR